MDSIRTFHRELATPCHLASGSAILPRCKRWDSIVADMSCATPVALILFKRPDLTARVFAAIRQARPPQLFLIADGPRNADEARLCQEARAVVQEVDWDCEVHRDFAERNLGCGPRQASGVDWVFGQVEEAIVLEDDCLPAPTFFTYCDRLLERYRDDPRVMHVGGCNFQARWNQTPYSYYFSKYAYMCGWATWRRAWQSYDFDMKTWPRFKKEGRLRVLCPDPVEAAFWEKKLDPVGDQRRRDTYVFQWQYAVWAQGGLAAVPSVNLIANIGYRADGTHTLDDARWGNQPLGEIPEIRHPPSPVADPEADRYTFDHFYGGNRARERRTWSHRLGSPWRAVGRLFRRTST